jgi:hypothetical protein
MKNIPNPKLVKFIESILLELNENKILKSERLEIDLDTEFDDANSTFVSNENKKVRIYLFNDNSTMLSILYKNGIYALNMTALRDFNFDTESINESLSILNMISDLNTKYTFRITTDEGNVAFECTLPLKNFNIENIENISSPMRNFIKNWIIGYSTEFKEAFDYIISSIKD